MDVESCAVRVAISTFRRRSFVAANECESTFITAFDQNSVADEIGASLRSPGDWIRWARERVELVHECMVEVKIVIRRPSVASRQSNATGHDA
jgi:hypothetical protein